MWPRRRLKDGTLTSSTGAALGLHVLHVAIGEFLSMDLVPSLFGKHAPEQTPVSPLSLLTPSASNDALEALHFRSSIDFVCAHLNLYLRQYASTSSESSSSAAEDTDETPAAGAAGELPPSVPTVQLCYPGAHVETFPLILPLREDYDPVVDLVKTVEFIAEDFPAIFGDPTESLQDGLFRRIERTAKKRDFDALQNWIHLFNQHMQRIIEQHQGRQLKLSPTLSYDQTSILLEQIYARTVTDPDSLRQYRGFSSEVYGETGHSIIRDIIRELPILQHHTFLDLGSGIGNVVLQVAAQTNCNAYGAELMERPAHFAKLQLKEYKARMRMYGREPGVVQLRRCNFLDDAKIHAILERVDVIFVNNYAFDAALNRGIMHLFLSMKEGAKIISFVAFRPLDYTITDHNMNDIASILTVRKQAYHLETTLKCYSYCIRYGPGSVSWTASPGEYFIHTIDRGPLKQFSERSSSNKQGRMLLYQRPKITGR